MGLPVIVAIAVLVSFMSQPKKGTVEWHKKEYLAAKDRATGSTWRDRIKRVYHKITKTTPPSERWGLKQQKNAETMSSNFTALLRMGYLTKRTFILSNRHGYDLEDTVRKSFDFGRNAFIWTESTTNALIIAAPSAVMPHLEDFVRKMDVP
jgi:type II secretory pathway component GspD/PulD (secretin)